MLFILAMNVDKLVKVFLPQEFQTQIFAFVFGLSRQDGSVQKKFRYL